MLRLVGLFGEAALLVGGKERGTSVPDPTRYIKQAHLESLWWTHWKCCKIYLISIPQLIVRGFSMGDKGLSRGIGSIKIPEFPMICFPDSMKLAHTVLWRWMKHGPLASGHVYILAFCFFASTESFDWCLWVCLPNCSNEQLNSISFSYFAP